MNGYLNHRRSRGMYVLSSETPEDVARAMINQGSQTQPFHLFDADEAYRRIIYFKRVMPRIKIFYAMKAFDYEWMLRLAISQGLGFDCSTPGEIKKVIQLNVDPSSIIYAMTTKTPEQMIYARECGVRHTTFDSLYELKKIKSYWPGAKLLLRVRVDSDSTYKLGEKFGCDFETEAIDLLEEAASLGLNVIGVAFHVGSICRSISSYALAIQHAHTLFEYEARAGRRMHVLDVGGGFLTDGAPSIEEAASIINKSLEKYFSEPSVQIIAEPGRYICDSSVTLYSSICNVRRAKRDNKSVTMIYMNEGVHGSLRYVESWHKIELFQLLPDKSKNQEDLEDVILWGPTCDSTDRVMETHSIRLPRCSPHDWLVIHSQGAYCRNFATRFSSLEEPPIRPVVSLELWKMIKTSAIFKPEDFILNPDISTPLPSNLPSLPVPVMISNGTYKKRVLSLDTAKIVDCGKSSGIIENCLLSTEKNCDNKR